MNRRMRATIAFLFLIFITATHADRPLFEEDFEYSGKNALLKQVNSSKLMEVVKGEGVNASKALKVAYEGYDQGSRRLIAKVPLGQALPEATLSYDVKFDSGFLFVKGGKLHGLGPEKPITGGKPMQPGGWSARATFKAQGGFSSYVYCQNKKGKYGQIVKADGFSFQKARYHAVSLHVKVNDPGQANGFMHIYVDGHPVVQHDGIEYRAAGGDGTMITQFLFSTFHGGHTPPYSPKDKDGNYITVHAFFDNFAIYSGKRVRAGPGQ